MVESARNYPNTFYFIKTILIVSALVLCMFFFLRKRRKNTKKRAIRKLRHKLAHPRHKNCSDHFFMAIFVFSTKKPMGIAAYMDEGMRNVVLVGGLAPIPNFIQIGWKTRKLKISTVGRFWLVGVVGQKMGVATSNSIYVPFGPLLAPIPNFIQIWWKTQKLKIFAIGWFWLVGVGQGGLVLTLFPCSDFGGFCIEVFI